MPREDAIEKGGSDGLPRGSTGYWLIVGRGGTRQALVLSARPRGGILPIFGSEEEAGTYLRSLGALGGGYATLPIAPEDLASLLSGPLSGIESVALDPMPGTDAFAGAFLDLVSTGRKGFVESLTDKRGSVTARGPGGRVG